MASNHYLCEMRKRLNQYERCQRCFFKTRLVVENVIKSKFLGPRLLTVGLLLVQGIQPNSREILAVKATMVDERLSCQTGAEQSIFSLANTILLWKSLTASRTHAEVALTER